MDWSAEVAEWPGHSHQRSERQWEQQTYALHLTKALRCIERPIFAVHYGQDGKEDPPRNGQDDHVLVLILLFSYPVL
jgi:hypothetical protein